MLFWIFMLVMNLLIPISMIGFGKLFMKTTPKEINGLFGYRTSMSMKNKDTWIFAHHYCGKLWYVIGRYLLFFTILAMLVAIGKEEEYVGKLGGIICYIQLILLVGSIYPTENALRKTFDHNGNRKNSNKINI